MVSLDVATETIESWLDYKKIKPKKREAGKPYIDNLIDAVQAGSLILNDDHSLDLILDWPIGIGTSQPIEKLNFKARITQLDKDKASKGVLDKSVDGSILITICALTGQSANVIKNLDESTDRSIADSIALFFL